MPDQQRVTAEVIGLRGGPKVAQTWLAGSKGCSPAFTSWSAIRAYASCPVALPFASGR